MSYQLSLNQRRMRQRERKLEEEFKALNIMMAEIYPEQREKLSKRYSWIKAESQLCVLFRRYFANQMRDITLYLRDRISRFLRSKRFSELAKRIISLYLFFNKDFW